MGTNNREQRERLAAAVYHILYHDRVLNSEGKPLLVFADIESAVREIVYVLQYGKGSRTYGRELTDKEAKTLFEGTLRTWMTFSMKDGGYLLETKPTDLLRKQAPTTTLAPRKKKRSRASPVPGSTSVTLTAYERMVVPSLSARLTTGRVEQGWIGAYMLAREKEMWLGVVGQVLPQPPDGWNLSAAPILRFDILLGVIGAEEDDLLEMIGRLCEANILRRDRSNGLGWRLIHNPHNVRIGDLERRWIVSASSTLLRETSNIRKRAETMRERHGLINLDRLFQALGAKTEARQDMLYDRFIRCDPRDAHYGEYGVLMECDADACYYVPSSLGGRDFIPYLGRDRTELINGDDARHTACVTSLRQHFIKIARES